MKILKLQIKLRILETNEQQPQEKKSNLRVHLFKDIMVPLRIAPLNSF